MLQQKRQQSQWTLLELAIRVQIVGGHMTAARLSDLETGTAKRGPTLDELCAIAYAINVAPARLLEGASLPGPLDVAVTPAKTMTQRGFRDWYRGRRAHRTDEQTYLLAVSDDDYLQLQRNTIQLLDHDIAALVNAAEDYRDDPSAENRHALADAIDQVAERRRILEQSQDNFPSERPRRQERRGRPRHRDGSSSRPTTRPA